MAENLHPSENKFHKGNSSDGKHYWLTPPKLMESMQLEFEFDADGCPYPKPDDFDGLTDRFEGKKCIYFNPPFGSIMHNGKKKGPTAWMRQAISLYKEGKKVIVVYPIDKWILMMIENGAKISNLGDVRWHSIEDGLPGKGTGRHIARFVLDPNAKHPFCKPMEGEFNQ